MEAKMMAQTVTLLYDELLLGRRLLSRARRVSVQGVPCADRPAFSCRPRPVRFARLDRNGPAVEARRSEEVGAVGLGPCGFSPDFLRVSVSVCRDNEMTFLSQGERLVSLGNSLRLALFRQHEAVGQRARLFSGPSQH